MTPQQIDQLYKLGRLKQDGMITEEQFNEETQKVKEWKYALDPEHPYAQREGWPTFSMQTAHYVETISIIKILQRLEAQLCLVDPSNIWEDYTEIRRRVRWEMKERKRVNSPEDDCILALATLKNNEVVTLDESSDLFSRILYKFPDESSTLPDREQRDVQDSKECYEAIILLKDKGLVGDEEYATLSTKLMETYPR